MYERFTTHEQDQCFSHFNRLLFYKGKFSINQEISQKTFKRLGFESTPVT